MTYTELSVETFPLGSSLTYDATANRGYLHVQPNPDAYAVARTVVLWEPDGLCIDLDQDGKVRGIETAGPVQLHHVLAVLRHVSSW